MAQTFARLGTEVIVLERNDQMLGREDKDAAQIVQAAFARDGIHLLLNVELQAMRKTATGKVLEYTLDGVRHECEVDEVLVSVGRVPTTKDLNLESAGIQVNDRGIVVSDSLQTTNPNVFVAGDVGFRYQFTHAADATARIVLQNALFPGPKRKASDLIVPWTTYTDPEVAHVGIVAHEAEAKGIAVQTFVQPLAAVDRARTDGETEGFVKIHIKKGSDKILGATIVATHAGEMIGEITTAMVAGVGLKTLAGVIHPYPTQMEAVKKIADQYNRSRLTPFVKRVLGAWMAWRR
jgi:pyruvate/2-oxoglutarate dehydrogenase complex dihydrolipoamide dehydrogenase (E3) component